ncbi:MAG: proline dehydrogenase family protein, partial [Acidimicrobiales bacterium]
VVVAAVRARLRSTTGDLILDADPGRLARHLARRRRDAITPIVNVLGEAVLGEAEAADRTARVLEMIARPSVDCVSVKLSSIASQLVTLDHAGSLARVGARLRDIYRAAARDGVFVNLDMEEYRDLRLTLDAFTSVLDEPEFATLAAGVVLQAYLPEAHDALDELIGWAASRSRRGASRVKVRLVKGANLAMERAEAQLHGWTPAPYATKADVDASYARLLDVALSPDVAGLRVAVASHNLFDVAWALEVAAARGVGDRLDVEMLEGMANAEALALARDGERVLVYTPVTRRDDFDAAVSYLVRRLDENTAPENYLASSLDIADDAAVFDDQRLRFAASVGGRHAVSRQSRRHGPAEALRRGFVNCADGDPTDPLYVDAVSRARDSLDARTGDWVGPTGDDPVDGIDPSAHGAPWYRYGVAGVSDVDAAVERARAAAPGWEARGAAARSALLERASDLIDESRASAIAVMARDAGKTVAESDPEVSEAVDYLRYYARRASDLDGSAPLGVVCVVPPWNFPYAIPAGGVAASLAAGNSVILKPAPEAVATAHHVAERLWAAGVPRDVLQVLPTRDDDVGRRLVTHAGVDAVVLTGAFDTARLFASWRPELNLLAETSGKNALVVTACADVDLAVRDLVASAFAHAGQKCSAASLGIIDASLLGEGPFVRQLVDAVTSLVVGPARDPATVVGPLIRPPEGWLAQALTSLRVGESWLVEPRALDAEGYLWRPGVKVDVRPGSMSHRQEWFGPVLGLMAAPDLDTAIEWQNGVDYGLTAGLHSLDVGECEHWLERVNAGNLYVNRPTTGAVVGRQPFGGWKRSAVGPTAKAGGRHYLECLRRWPRVDDVDAALAGASEWWRDVGALALDESGLDVERNVARYRRLTPATARGEVLVRVDASTSSGELAYLDGLGALTGQRIVAVADPSARVGPSVERLSLDELVTRQAPNARLRWLSAEAAPVDVLLARGVSLDRRPLAQAGHVEAPRWLHEQSVAVTNHRYGNVRAGPKPRVPGLGVA